MTRNQLTEMQEKWLTALESGEYNQVTDQLCTRDGYCCLGVATHVVAPDHSALDDNGWVRRSYLDQYELEDLIEIGPDEKTAPPEVYSALNLNNTEGMFRLRKPRHGVKSLIDLNDHAGLTFPEIAALIRKEPWLVFTNFDVPKGALEAAS